MPLWVSHGITAHRLALLATDGCLTIDGCLVTDLAELYDGLVAPWYTRWQHRRLVTTTSECQVFLMNVFTETYRLHNTRRSTTSKNVR